MQKNELCQKIWIYIWFFSFSFQSPCASFSVIFKIRLQRQRTTQKLFELMGNSSSSGASWMKFVLYLFLLFISGLMDVASKQMPADNIPQIKYDVFINFRSRTFVTVFLVIWPRLSIKSKYMPLFVNGKLEKGDEIWPSLVGAIQAGIIDFVGHILRKLYFTLVYVSLQGKLPIVIEKKISL